jgi:hypothetical protein
VPSTTGGTSYSVSWLASPSGTVTAYELYESTSSGFSSQTNVYSNTGTSASITGAAPGLTTTACARVIRASAPRTPPRANGIVVDQSAPTQPGTPGFNIVGTTVTASWTGSTDNVGVAGYDYHLNGSSSWTQIGTGTSYSIQGLTSNTGYTFGIRARDAVGNVSAESSAGFTTCPPPPDQPSGLAYNQIADCAWNASWSAAANATYYIFADTNLATQQTSGLPRRCPCPQGNPEANKPKWVQACNATACSVKSNFGAASDFTPPTTPGTPQFSNLTSTSVTVTWSPSSDFSGIAAYDYNYGTGWITIGSVPNVSLTGLIRRPATRSRSARVTTPDSLAAPAPHRSRRRPRRTPRRPARRPPWATPAHVDLGHPSAGARPATNVGVTGYEYRLNGAPSWTDRGNQSQRAADAHAEHGLQLRGEGA